MTGRAARSSLTSEGINAISKMMKVIRAIEDYSTTLAMRNHKLLRSKEALTFDPGIHGFPATCDAGDLSKRMPTVIFGPGSLSQAHQPDEYVSIGQVLDASIAYAAIAIAVLR